jgi:hypothetical protein
MSSRCGWRDADDSSDDDSSDESWWAVALLRPSSIAPSQLTSQIQSRSRERSRSVGDEGSDSDSDRSHDRFRTSRTSPPTGCRVRHCAGSTTRLCGASSTMSHRAPPGRAMRSAVPATRQAAGAPSAWSQPSQSTHARPRRWCDAGPLGQSHSGPEGRGLQNQALRLAPGTR